MGRRNSTIAEFWAKVDKTGECWLWAGGRDRDGYGKARFHNRGWRAHRIAWELTFGPIPPETPRVLHRCDLPACVNPSHLWLGTDDDNMKDKVRKGRQSKGDTHYTRTTPERAVRGTSHGRARLTDSLVREIRQRRALGETATSIGLDLGVSRCTVTTVAARRSWKHVT